MFAPNAEDRFIPHFFKRSFLFIWEMTAIFGVRTVGKKDFAQEREIE